MTAAIVAVPLDEAWLVRSIKAHIAKGDQAKEKSEQHYIAAGQHLKTLKAEHKGSWAEWEELLKTKIGIGKSRASELMQIADGTKTVEQVNERRAKSMRENRQRKISPPRGGENANDPETSAKAITKAKLSVVSASTERTAPTLFYQACQLLERMDDPSRQYFFDGPIAQIIEECAHPAEEEVLELVEEVLGGDTLSDKQTAAFEKLKKRLRRKASAAAKQTAQFKTHINEYKVGLSAFAARLKAAGVARDLWLALSVRGPCGFREGIAMWQVPPLVDAIEEAIGPEAARETATCTIEPNGEVAPVENAPPPDVGAENMKAQITTADDGIPEMLRRKAKAEAGEP